MDQRYARFINATSSNRQASAIRKTYGVHSPGTISLAAGLPHHVAFPILEGSFKLLDGRTISITPDLMKSALQYLGSNGYTPLLEKIQLQTLRLHSPPCWSTSSQLITNGNQSGVYMALDMLMNKGDYILIEEPCYAGTLGALNPYQPRFLGVEVDEDGLRVDKLKAILSRWKPEDARKAFHGVPKVLYTTPNGCNPSGGMTSAERRKEIYQICSDYDIMILEDDPYYFLTFREFEDFPPSYLSMDTDGRVLRFDSFSKTLSAGIRIGYVTGPNLLVEKLTNHQQVMTCHANSFTQVMLDEILQAMGEDGFIEHALKVRKFYQDRRDVFLKFTRKYLTGLCEWTEPAGGMFLWLKVLGIKDSDDLLYRIAEPYKILVLGGRGFMTDSFKPSPYLRVSFSYGNIEDMEEGIRRLALGIKSVVA